MGKHNEFGKLGEQKAVDFLLKKGYEILYRNYRYLKGEIDIIAKKEDTLCIVEVKSRTSGFFETISDTITKKKIGLLVTTASHYVEENDLDVDVRFDVITIIKKQERFEIEHLENAFYHF
ncbi:YraN family protein [Flagellimonas sp. HMM57]|uniref:YraN family protein n=1 Tax=unclassified Flagellimonas TaxID=2644544 RepID=UPI0013D831E1|nr:MULTISPECIES: YraN family protein [unclassified Flagellimonas]UII77281.1 YraN family protein [Flagellimonas sp. HMM57]